MTPSPRTRLIALALTASLLPGLAACGAGFDASVDEVTGHNSDSNLNGILARDIVVVKAPQSSTAVLAGTLINSGHRADTLQTVSFTDDAPGSQTLTITPNLGLAPGQLLPLGAGSTAPISIPNAQGITVGDFVYADLHFAQAGDMHMQVAVADRSFYFSNLGGTPTATPTAAATQADAPGRAAFAGTRIVTDPRATTKTAHPQPTATPAVAPKKSIDPAAVKAAPAAAKPVPAPPAKPLVAEPKPAPVKPAAKPAAPKAVAPQVPAKPTASAAPVAKPDITAARPQ